MTLIEAQELAHADVIVRRAGWERHDGHVDLTDADIAANDWVRA